MDIDGQGPLIKLNLTPSTPPKIISSDCGFQSRDQDHLLRLIEDIFYNVSKHVFAVKTHAAKTANLYEAPKVCRPGGEKNGLHKKLLFVVNTLVVFYGLPELEISSKLTVDNVPLEHVVPVDSTPGSSLTLLGILHFHFTQPFFYDTLSWKQQTASATYSAGVDSASADKERGVVGM